MSDNDDENVGWIEYEQRTGKGWSGRQRLDFARGNQLSINTLVLMVVLFQNAKGRVPTAKEVFAMLVETALDLTFGTIRVTNYRAQLCMWPRASRADPDAASDPTAGPDYSE